MGNIKWKEAIRTDIYLGIRGKEGEVVSCILPSGWVARKTGVEEAATELYSPNPLALLGTYFKALPGPNGDKTYVLGLSGNVSQSSDLLRARPGFSRALGGVF